MQRLLPSSPPQPPPPPTLSDTYGPVKRQLYDIAASGNKARSAILVELCKHVADNAHIYKHSFEMLAQVLILMSEKSDVSIMLYDVENAWKELEKRIPYLAREIRRQHGNVDLEQLLLRGIERYNEMTGKELVLNKEAYGLTSINMPDDVVKNIYSNQHLSDQLSLAQTSQFHRRAFLDRFDERLSRDAKVSDLKNTMSPFLIYFTKPEYVNVLLAFPQDDKHGWKYLAQLKIDGPLTRQRIRSGEFKTVQDVRESRKANLGKLVNRYTHRGFDASALEGMVKVSKLRRGEEEMVKYERDWAGRPSLEQLCDVYYDSNAHVKYYGDGVLPTRHRIYCESFRVVCHASEFQECIDRGLLSAEEVSELFNRQQWWTGRRLCQIYLGIREPSHAFELPTLPCFSANEYRPYARCKELIDQGYLSLRQILELDEAKFERLIEFFRECGEMTMQQFLELAAVQMKFGNLCLEGLKLPASCAINFPEPRVKRLCQPWVQHHMAKGLITLNDLHQIAGLDEEKFQEKMDWFEITRDPTWLTDDDASWVNNL